VDLSKPIPCCECLRSKSVYFNPEERPGRLMANDDTVVFWCTLTQSPVGPDGQPAHPRACGRDRVCCRMKE